MVDKILFATIGFGLGILFIVFVFYINAYNSIKNDNSITLQEWYGIEIVKDKK